MSSGVRLPLEWAVAAARELFQRWELNPSTCLLCGSVRRRCAEVGDLDIIAPLPPYRKADELHAAIDRTVIVPEDSAGLFADRVCPKFTEVRSGHKPYFKSLSVVTHLEASGVTYPIPVQINRYTPENRGWMEIYKTGPREFGVWFLVKWKEKFGIPLGDSHKASIDNHLRDASGAIVPVPTEQLAFTIAGLRYIEPENRDEETARIVAGWSREHRERLA